MRWRAVLVVVPSLLLALAAAVFATRAARHVEGFRVETGRVRLTRLSEDLKARLASLRDDVLITYYCSPRHLMPSHMRQVERDVTDLLVAMRDAAGGKLDFHLVDPTGDADLTKFAAKRAVAPVRVRHVERDAYSEQEVWSTLTFAYGPRKPAMISGISPEHLPRLQSLVVAHLNQLESPRAPVFAVSAPSGFSKLREYLAGAGRILPIDLRKERRIPAEADVLFWIDPGPIDADHVRNLRHFLERGGSAVVAGGLYSAELRGAAGAEELALAPTDFGMEALLGPFGLHPVPGLVLDRRSAELTLPTGEQPAPFRVLCLALNQDFQGLAKEPRGSLLFVAPTPFSLDTEQLAANGTKAEVLATSSDESTLLTGGVPGAFPIGSLAAGPGEAVPKQPLVVWVRPADAWQGSLVAVASSCVFRDETFVIETLAHKRLTEALAATLASDERLVVGRSGLTRPPPLPALAPGARALWRAVVMLAFPLLLLAAAVVRARRSGPRAPATAGAPAWRGAIALRAALALACVGALSAAARSVALHLDLTEGRLNELAPRSRELAREAGGEGAVEIDIFASDDARLPPELKPHLAALRGRLRDFERAGAEFTVRTVHPEDATEAERAALADAGVRPFQATSRDDEVTTVRTVYSALRMRARGRTEVLPLRDADAFENLEFRIAFALFRLATGRAPHIGFASDAPRMSAAEAYQFYQSAGLIPPSGKDVYSVARDLVRGADFRVTHINPREPVLPPDLDVLVWLQPRRAVAPMLEQMLEYLCRGGKVLLAAQHFSMQSRQYRGTGFPFVYWPQPQSPDVEEFYFPGLGIHLVRQVLFDALHTRIDLESQIQRTGRREWHPMNLAKPFLIRAAAANFDTESTITHGLGDQAFLFAAYFDLDAARLGELGIRARPLITTSDLAWTFDWKGGWLPNPLLEAPPALGELTAEEAERTQGALSRLPLAVLFEGQFPWPESAFVHPAVKVGADGTVIERDPVPPYPRPAPASGLRPGKLLFFGCSELFKDQRLTELRPEFRGDHLLLNSVASLALDDGLAAVMGRRTVPRGFDRIEPERRVVWRLVVLLAFPALLAVLAFFRLVLRPREERWPTIAGASLS